MALAALDDLKAMLSIQQSDDDALLTRLLAAASAYFERQVGRSLAANDYTITMDGTGWQLVPPQYPVISVKSININGNDVTESTDYTMDGWYIQDGVIRLRGSTAFYVNPQFTPYGFRPWDGNGNVLLEYRAGYETIPDDVQQAVLEMAALMYRERDRVGQQSHNNAAGSTVFYYAPPARVVSTIQAYRRVL